MTLAEKKAFEYGKTYSGENNAPCYDSRMNNMVIDARSKAGRDYNSRVIRAWWAGRVEAGYSAPDWYNKGR